MCGRYTINCEIAQIQNTQIDHTEVTRCTLSVGCPTDLDYCVVFVDKVSVFLEHMQKTLKASKCIPLDFTCLLAPVASTTNTATFT